MLCKSNNSCEEFTGSKLEMSNHVLAGNMESISFVTNDLIFISKFYAFNFLDENYILWRQIELKSQNGTLFSHVWRRGRLALDPLQNKSCSEFFSQADKNWHITWGDNLGPDWPPLARGSKIHTITHPPGSFLPSPR